MAWLGLIADQHPAVYQLLTAAELTHGKGMQSYLCMMAVRLLEMRRVLKDTGSLYLHCDPTASHYLKGLMDAVFGAANFRSEITWRRTNAKGLSYRGYPNNADYLLYYSISDDFTWHRSYRPYDQEYVQKFYRYVEPDTGRRYRLSDLTNPNRNRPNLTYEFLGVTRVWRWTQERMQRAYEQGRVVQSRPGAVPSQKRYLDEMPGNPVDSIWDDIRPVQAQAKERTGYPTQKPLALLERIIAASSNEGDMVLDPFAGCATACVAAEKLGRQWIGIDLSPKAVELVKMRLAELTASLRQERQDVAGLVTARTDIPRRTDVGTLPPYRQQKHVLFGQQEGRCAGCDTEFPFRAFDIDHIIPQSRGGTDHPDNLQLLCSHCNRVKGDRPQEYLLARLGELGLR